MKEKKVMKLASRGKRFGAFCIDAVLPIVATIIFFVAMIAVIVAEMMYYPGFGFGSPGFNYGYGYNRGPSAGAVTAMIISLLLSVTYIVIQLVLFNKSQTIGKAALGLQVVSSVDGEPIGFWKMLFREWFVKAASGSVFLLGFIWVLIDDRNRGWHDKILDTYVVDLKESAALYPSSNDRQAEAAHDQSSASTQDIQAGTPAAKSAPLPVQETKSFMDEGHAMPSDEAADSMDASVEDIYDSVNAVTIEDSASETAASEGTDIENITNEPEVVIELPGPVTSPEVEENQENEE